MKSMKSSDKIMSLDHVITEAIYKQTLNMANMKGNYVKHNKLRGMDITYNAFMTYMYICTVISVKHYLFLLDCEES